MARPKSSEPTKTERLAPVRELPEQKARLERAAEVSGLGWSQWVRVTLGKAADRVLGK